MNTKGISCLLGHTVFLWGAQGSLAWEKKREPYVTNENEKLEPHSRVPPPLFLNQQEQAWTPKAVAFTSTPKPQTPFWTGVDSGFTGVWSWYKLVGEAVGFPLFMTKNTQTVYFCKFGNNLSPCEHTAVAPLLRPFKRGTWSTSFISFLSVMTTCLW